MSKVPLGALVAASGISSAGVMMTLIAIPWFVLQSTGSGTKTGLVTAAEVLGLTVAALLGGPIVDRVGTRRASVGADLLTTGTVLLIPLAVGTTGLGLPGLVVLSFVMGVSRGPADTAKQVLLAGAVELGKIRPSRGASAVEAAMRTGRMVGGPAAGALIAVSGPIPVLFVDAGALLLSAALIFALIPAAAGPPRATSDGYLKELREGLAYVKRDRVLRALVGMLMLTNSLDFGLLGVLYPAYGDQVLHSTALIGAMITAVATGGLLGSALYGWVGHRFSRRSALLVAVGVEGAPRFALLALEPTPAVLLAGLVVAGLGAGALNPILLPVVYERVPEAVRGRVFSLLVGGVLAAMPLGSMTAGVLLDGAGLVTTLAMFGGLYLIAGTFPAIFRVWRGLDDPAPIERDRLVSQEARTD
ncbi:MFS transporter [Amycolatopsis regifaucium]|uniref:MFS transporter n=1 Tax=Amycolatopsis regifaucium TaxID=546365 RepID=A0A154MUX0_9PSEU|nr:MFS transporter [Amycolatopsis regifaucium]KZB88072.1 MFS transporter [Amycolatopsis regifaucium]OKA04424.1 MFS transporter [Amycolatopsis regifaucium]SFH48811.1 Predicted arabinose efflux permease, MFS family [Amycolatopsis regifaucium]